MVKILWAITFFILKVLPLIVVAMERDGEKILITLSKWVMEIITIWLKLFVYLSTRLVGFDVIQI